MFNEILDSILSNKLKSFLSGLGIIWGITILIILVGIGNGFQNGVLKQFEGFANKTLYVVGGKTAINRFVYNDGRIYFTEKDIISLKSSIPAIKKLSPEVHQNCKVAYESYSANLDVTGVYPEYFDIKVLKVSNGRLLNKPDFFHHRKVALIGLDIAAAVFGKNKNVVGKMININGTYYTVIGIIKTNLLTTPDSRSIYIPLSTFSASLNKMFKINLLVMSIYNGLDTKKVQDRIKFLFAFHHDLEPKDDGMLVFTSVEEQVQAFNNFFAGLKSFLWFMGISTLSSGVIGVGNIMYTVAKERTQEIGIRKAVGARNSSIMWLFVWESVLITSLAGVIGIIIGTAVLKGIGLMMEVKSGVSIFQTPQIDLKIILGAAIILSLCGTIAGSVPAVYAARLKPIDALKK